MILLTGGLGFIGSHVAAELAAALQPQQQQQQPTDEGIVILDNLANSNIGVLATLRSMFPKTTFFFHEGDIRDRALLDLIFRIHGSIHTVIHFAGLKSVKESFAKKEEYDAVNVGGTETLLDAMEAAGCRNFIFSSSATVYGTAPSPLTEASEVGVGISNPYGETKWAVECLLKTRTPTIRSVVLRYFNPIGAHVSGLLGEAPNGAPNNLFPILLKAVKERRTIEVFGNDWPTRDGTCARDYVDIQDLATAHVAAVNRFDSLVGQDSIFTMNIATGVSTTVLELLAAFETATGIRVPYTIAARRPGDLAEVYAVPDPSRMDLLEWRPVHSIEESCRNGWKFASAT